MAAPQVNLDQEYRPGADMYRANTQAAAAKSQTGIVAKGTGGFDVLKGKTPARREGLGAAAAKLRKQQAAQKPAPKTPKGTVPASLKGSLYSDQ